MLSIQHTDSAPLERVKPNILPCEINYTGKTNISTRYWDPRTETIKGSSNLDGHEDKTVQIAYFRGRRLLGRTTALPEGYRGAIVAPERKSLTNTTAAAVQVSAGERKQESAFSRIARRNASPSSEDEEGDYEGVVVIPSDDEDGDDAAMEDADASEEVPLEAMEQISSFQDITVWQHDVEPDADDPFIRGVEEWLQFAKAIHGSDAVQT